MDKINLLKNRRAELLACSREIREKISSLTDENSFVELDSYSFSHSDFYDEDAHGEGVVTGYATLNDTPIYIVAQNVKVLSGGVSLANCKKIVKCLKKAGETGYPVVYLFDSLGVRVGEGVNVLEGIAEVLDAAAELKGNVPQISVVTGKLFGSFALLASMCDYNFMTDSSVAAYASPLVISAASGKKLTEEEVGGAKVSAYNSLATFKVSDISEVKDKIADIISLLPAYSDAFDTSDDDFNRSTASLNEKVCPKCLIKAVFDNGKFLEMNESFCPELVTGIGRVGGMSVAAMIFDGGDKGVELNFANIQKATYFATYAAENGLPLITFVNTLGIKNDLKVNNSTVLKEINELIAALRANERLSVVYGKAVGLGYTLFASKGLGVSYSYAFANAKIGLFDGAVSAAAFGEVKEEKLAELEEKYSEENEDPINAAKNGYIDNIIEPQFVRAYVISALQTIVR